MTAYIVTTWNTAGAWYMSRDSDGLEHYALCSGENQKNGKAICLLVNLDTTRPRAKPRCKRVGIDREWQRQFALVENNDVPAMVLVAGRLHRHETQDPAFAPCDCSSCR